jgi:DNA repair ATPase RecN
MKHKILYIKALALFFIVGALSGCAELNLPTGSSGMPQPTLIFTKTAAGTLLACNQEADNLPSKEFKKLLKESRAALDKRADDEATLRFICLAIHPQADYGQFKKAMRTLEEFATRHPDDRQELEGLLALLKRLDRAKLSRWSTNKKMIDAQKQMLDEQQQMLEDRKALEAEVAGLQEARQEDNRKIAELQHQIEQLKNIEKIIKNRDHFDPGTIGYD